MLCHIELNKTVLHYVVCITIYYMLCYKCGILYVAYYLLHYERVYTVCSFYHDMLCCMLHMAYCMLYSVFYDRCYTCHYCISKFGAAHCIMFVLDHTLCGKIRDAYSILRVQNTLCIHAVHCIDIGDALGITCYNTHYML